MALGEIVRSQFPRIQPNPPAPVYVTVEFTTYCNLHCVYCLNQLALRPRGFMQRDIFDRVIEGIKKLRVTWVRVLGNGEATLHPEFCSFVREIGHTVPYVSLLTNAHWKKPTEIVLAMLEAPVSLIEISVDGSDATRYEESRRGGSFAHLIDNLTLLNRVKRLANSRSRIHIRLMLRPSEQASEGKLVAFWKNYGETVIPQYVIYLNELGYREDVYGMNCHDRASSFPKCRLPFVSLDVNWNGDVPLCSLSSHQVGPPGLILGNVGRDTLLDIWNSNVMRQYRAAHYTRDASKMPVCSGCMGT